MFINYLQSRYHYDSKTIKAKENQLSYWESLCVKDQDLRDLQTEELYKIISVAAKNYEPSTVNYLLKTLEQYYYYLIEKGERDDHPLKGFRVKKPKPPLLQGLLTEAELDNLYETYSEKGHFGGQFDVYRKRNKVLVGLMIYQGLGTGSLKALQVEDVNLEKGLIHVPATTENRLKFRILPLSPNQILGLYHYVHETRKELLQLIKIEQTSTLLFPVSQKIKFMPLTLKNQLKISSLQQLRNSRISIWLKQYNPREVQYRAGYKSLQSLEKFNQSEIESLKQAVEKYHPF